MMSYASRSRGCSQASDKDLLFAPFYFFPDKACFELRSPLFWEKPERQVIYYSIFHNELAYITDILKIGKTIDTSCVMCQSQARNFCSAMETSNK